jgi:uncharacterized protein YheU (UPF0270 family)
MRVRSVRRGGVVSEDGVEIPVEQLSEAVLRALIEEFVSRDGTDYGAVERSLDEKAADVRRQLDLGEARIVFDPELESATIVAVADRR